MSVSKGDTSAAGGRRAARWHTAWAVLLVSSTLVAAAIGVALLAETTATRRLFDNVHWTLSYGTAALLAWFGAARSRQEERRARRLFAWALTSYFVGQVLWDIQVAIALNPFPGPSDLFYFGTGLLMGWGVLSCVRQHVPTSDRRTALLDLAALFTASLALALAVCLPRRGNTEPFALVVLIAYPLVLSLTAVSATILLLWARIAPRLGWWLFLSGLWLNWYLWLEWNFRTLAGTLADGTLYNALFSVDALVLGAGVWLLELEPSRGERLRPRATTWLRLLPLLSVVIGAGAVVLAVTLSHVAPLARLLAISGGLVVVLLASLRQLAQLDAHEQLIAAEQQLNRVETSYRLLVEQAVDGIFITDGRGVYVNVNQRGAQMLRARPEELIGLSIADVLPEHELPRLEGAIGELHAGKEMGQRWQLRRRDNTLFDAEITAKKLPDGRLQGLVRDISEQVALEGQLRQAQKMEAIGSLAAGIAHDFNNLLGAIQGNAELAQDEVGERHPAFESIGEIRKATQRAAALVRQILSFSRPRMPSAVPVDVAGIGCEVVRLLRSTLPLNVEFVTHFHPDLPKVEADPAQVHQVLLNLCTNAWHALDQGPGRIEIAVEPATVPGAGAVDARPGEYVRVTVSDNGTGMSAATLERIFEPFFTTKERGRGTGLGLAVVHGIVRQHGGVVSVDSELGRGTAFSVYLPRSRSEVSPEVGDRQAAAAEPNGVRVAYVDDEAQLVRLIVTQLRKRGYSANGYTSADELMSTNPKAGSFDVVLSDYDMPRVNGLELFRRLRAAGVGVPFVLASGWISEDLQHRAQALGIEHLLYKPLNIVELCALLNGLAHEARKGRSSARAVIDSASTPASLEPRV